jgi:diaminopimelate epimerase
VTQAEFDKVEGLGNDFVVMAVEDESGVDVERARRICDRHFGVGADGVLFLLPPRDGGVARMRVVNADGSVPEMCGNGLRCVALLLAASQDLREGELVVETDAGSRACRVTRGVGLHEGGVVDVEMGVVRVEGSATETVQGVVVDMVLADAGNPHAIVYRDSPEADLASLGRLIATHPRFASTGGRNAELVRWNGGALEVFVWERGAGPTLACGTGACAAVAVACSRGEAASQYPVNVRLPGGALVVTHDGVTGLTRMKGPARHVFHGVWQD